LLYLAVVLSSPHWLAHVADFVLRALSLPRCCPAEFLIDLALDSESELAFSRKLDENGAEFAVSAEEHQWGLAFALRAG